jgi:two-component system, chemotaxis family, chemotaxis protein CheY
MSATVLVVDDSATVRQQVGVALTQAGFVVVEARDGEEGKAKIDKGGIDCVICDVNMPNLNGIDMVADVKEDVRHQQLPIIMLTTEGARELIDNAKKAGACGWIVKPFKPELLVAAVQKLTASAQPV